MRTGLIIIICCSFFITACKNKSKVPAGIIPQKKMQTILWDMMRADQFLGDFVFNNDSGLDKRAESSKLYSQVLAIHQINKEEFVKSFSFYKTHTSLMKALMDSLSRPKPEAPTEMINQPIPPDSFQSSPGNLAKPDSGLHFRKKKSVPRIKEV